MKNIKLAELLNLKRRSVIFHRLKKVFSSYQLKSREFLGRKKYQTSVEGEEAENKIIFMPCLLMLPKRLSVGSGAKNYQLFLNHFCMVDVNFRCENHGWIKLFINHPPQNYLELFQKSCTNNTKNSLSNFLLLSSQKFSHTITFFYVNPKNISAQILVQVQTSSLSSSSLRLFKPLPFLAIHALITFYSRLPS